MVLRPGIRDVAQKAGVGISSVSRVLSNHPDVSQIMRQRVTAAIEVLGYQPNLVARGMRNGITGCIGFMVSDISNPLLSEIVQGAEEVLSENDFSLILTASNDSSARDAAQIRQLHQRRADGLILLTAAEDDPSTGRMLAMLDVPFVVLDREFSRQPDLYASYVLSDHRTGMRDAVRHLLDLGHRRIAIVIGRNVRPSRERLRAVQDTLLEEGEGAILAVESDGSSIEDGRSALVRLLDRSEPPTAVILGGNLLLYGALDVIRDRRMVLGRDLSLVGCDDAKLTRLLTPTVSVVARDAHQIGCTAAQLILKRISGDGGPESVTLPTWYEARDSCGQAPRMPRGQRRRRF